MPGITFSQLVLLLTAASLMYQEEGQFQDALTTALVEVHGQNTDALQATIVLVKIASNLILKLTDLWKLPSVYMLTFTAMEVECTDILLEITKEVMQSKF